jgi:hypothetical protein
LAQLSHLLAQIGEDGVLRQALVLALLERLQAHKDDAGVRCVGECGTIEADEGNSRLDARSCQHDIAGLTHDLIGAA